MNEIARSLEQITAEAVIIYNRMERDYAEWGRLMIEARKLVPYGKWLDYLQEHFPAFSQRQSYRYMEMAKSPEIFSGEVNNRSRNATRDLTSTSNLQREVRAIERNNDIINERSSYVPGLVIQLDSLDLTGIGGYELGLMKQACERLINRINVQGEKGWPRLIVSK